MEANRRISTSQKRPNSGEYHMPVTDVELQPCNQGGIRGSGVAGEAGVEGCGVRLTVPFNKCDDESGAICCWRTRSIAAHAVVANEAHWQNGDDDGSSGGVDGHTSEQVGQRPPTMGDIRSRSRRR